MKYPVETLILGFEDIRLSERKRIEEYLEKNQNTLDKAVESSNDAILSWVHACARIVKMHTDGALYNEDTGCLVNDKLVEVFDESMKHHGGFGQYRGSAPGSNSSNIKGCIKNVSDSKRDLDGNSEPGDLEIFLMGMRDQGEEFVTDYGVQSAGFNAKLGGAYTRGLRVLAERENTTP